MTEPCGGTRIRWARLASAFGLAASLIMAPLRLDAQESGLAVRCAAAVAGELGRQACGRVAQAVEIAQAPLGLAVTGGNPVPGTASTLGMRIGSIPRLSLAGRFSATSMELPGVLDLSGGRIDASLPSLNADAAIGLFSGFSPAPTVGGVLAVDLLASAGVLFLPGGDGFVDGSAFSWSIGTRVGAFRESFTLPGVSASLMYRRVGDMTLGDPLLDRDDGFFDLDLSVWSARAAVSKRILLFGLTAGAGYDRYSSDVRFGVVNPEPVAPQEIRVSLDDFENDRFLVFGNVSWTMLVLHLVGEIGWQEGAEQVPDLSPLRAGVDPEDGRLFGSLAIRLSI